jgi:hypothetical protein
MEIVWFILLDFCVYVYVHDSETVDEAGKVIVLLLIEFLSSSGESRNDKRSGFPFMRVLDVPTVC